MSIYSIVKFCVKILEKNCKECILFLSSTFRLFCDQLFSEDREGVHVRPSSKIKSEEILYAMKSAPLPQVLVAYLRLLEITAHDLISAGFSCVEFTPSILGLSEVFQLRYIAGRIISLVDMLLDEYKHIRAMNLNRRMENSYCNLILFLSFIFYISLLRVVRRTFSFSVFSFSNQYKNCYKYIAHILKYFCSFKAFLCLYFHRITDLVTESLKFVLNFCVLIFSEAWNLSTLLVATGKESDSFELESSTI